MVKGVSALTPTISRLAKKATKERTMDFTTGSVHCYKCEEYVLEDSQWDDIELLRTTVTEVRTQQYAVSRTRAGTAIPKKSVHGGRIRPTRILSLSLSTITTMSSAIATPAHQRSTSQESAASSADGSPGTAGAMSMVRRR